MSSAVTFEDAVAWVAAGIDRRYHRLVDMPAVVREVFSQTPAGWVRTGEDGAVISAISRHSNKALAQDRLYLVHDRIVCGRIGCAGGAAVATGTDLHGRHLSPVTERDVREWIGCGFDSMDCECGALSWRPGEVKA